MKRSGPRRIEVPSRSATFAAAALAWGLTLACGLAAPVTDAPSSIPTPTADQAVELPFEGVWWSDAGKVLVLTPTTFYTHENEQDYDRQVFGEILAFDLEQASIEYRMRAIYINGEPAGFDSPMRHLRYAREGDMLRVSFGSEGLPTVFDETFTRR